MSSICCNSDDDAHECKYASEQSKGEIDLVAIAEVCVGGCHGR